MEQLQSTETTISLLKSRSGLEQFKVCTLCGSLNVAENNECFVCRWHGSFDRNPSLIRLRIYEIVRNCPDFWEVWSSLPGVSKTPKWKRVWNKIVRRFRRRKLLDIRI